MIGNGWNRIFVSIRDAEHFVSDDAGTTRRAKRRGQGAVTGETKMGIKRIVNRKPISPSNRALPASVFRGPVKIRDKLSLKIRDKGG